MILNDFIACLRNEGKKKVKHFLVLTVFNQGISEIFLVVAPFGTEKGQWHDAGVLDQVGDVEDEGAPAGFSVEEG